jgi:hypothetical protein
MEGGKPHMKYMLMDYVKESGWPQLSADDKERWLGVYRAYVEAMAEAGVLKGSGGLMPTSAATTVRVVEGKTQVLDGPYADSKEQLAGYHVVDVPDLDAAIAWAARCPTAIYGVVEVRPLRESSDDPVVQRFIEGLPKVAGH